MQKDERQTFNILNKEAEDKNKIRRWQISLICPDQMFKVRECVKRCLGFSKSTHRYWNSPSCPLSIYRCWLTTLRNVVYIWRFAPSTLQLLRIYGCFFTTLHNCCIYMEVCSQHSVAVEEALLVAMSPSLKEVLVLLNAVWLDGWGWTKLRCVKNPLMWTWEAKADLKVWGYEALALPFLATLNPSLS